MNNPTGQFDASKIVARRDAEITGTDSGATHMTGPHDREYVRVAAIEAAQRAKARISEAALRSADLAECERRCGKIQRRFDHGATPAPPSVSKRFAVDVTKVLPDQRQVFGWASVCSRGGRPVIDKQGDIIPVNELEPAVYEYVLSNREGGDMHVVKGASRCIESVMFTQEAACAWDRPGHGRLVCGVCHR
jgi:hypothetical protein